MPERKREPDAPMKAGSREERDMLLTCCWGGDGLVDGEVVGFGVVVCAS